MNDNINNLLSENIVTFDTIGVSVDKNIPYIMETEKVLKGEPGGGEVEFIKQIHRPPREKALTVSEEIKTLIGETQLSIYKYLKKQNAEVIFYEGSVAKDDTIEMVKKVSPDIYNKDWSELSKDEKLLFSSKIGGAEIYGYTHPGVKMFPTTNKEIRKKTKEILDAKTQEELVQKMREQIGFILYVREKFSADLIENYIKQNPNEKVFLIFGACHKFEDDFQKFKKQPKMLRTQLKNVDSSVAESIVDEMIQAIDLSKTKRKTILTPIRNG